MMRGNPFFGKTPIVAVAVLIGLLPLQRLCILCFMVSTCAGSNSPRNFNVKWIWSGAIHLTPSAIDRRSGAVVSSKYWIVSSGGLIAKNVRIRLFIPEITCVLVLTRIACIRYSTIYTSRSKYGIRLMPCCVRDAAQHVLSQHLKKRASIFRM